MWSSSSLARSASFAAVTLLLTVTFSAVAQALPQSGSAEPPTVGVVGRYAYNSWQNYQTASGVERYCALDCLGLGRYAGILEENAEALNQLARNPKLSDADHRQALADFNAVSKRRNELKGSGLIA